MHIANILTAKVLVIGNMYRYVGKFLFSHPNKRIWVLFRSFRRVVRHKNRPPWVLARLALLLLISVKNLSHFVSAIFESPCSRLRRSTKKEWFEGVFGHRKAHPIYPDISDPIISRQKVISYWTDRTLHISFIADIIAIFSY